MPAQPCGKDFTKSDYREMCDEIFSVAEERGQYKLNPSGYYNFCIFFPVGDDGERLLRLEGYVDVEYCDSCGDGYTTQVEKWYEGTIHLDSYECRTIDYAGCMENFCRWPAAICDFDPKEVDWKKMELDFS